MWLVSIALLILGTWVAHRHFVRQDRTPQPRYREPISILKPLKGIDGNLESNLETFFNLKYPIYEILFSVAEESDPAKPIVEKLIAKYPRRNARLLIGETRVGINPKVNNLIKSYNAAVFNWILISDSNVRVEPDYLDCMAEPFANDVGIVTSAVFGSKPEGVGGWLEYAYLNSFHARWMILVKLFGKPICMGKSMLFRKSDANRFGGFATLGRYLAEDYMAGEAMRKLGLRIEVPEAPIEQPLPNYSLDSFWKRHVRWGRIRKNQAPVANTFEPLTGALASGLIGAFAASQGFGIDPLKFLIAHLFFWCWCDMRLLNALGGRTSLRSLGAWLTREFIAIPMWAHTVSGNTVSWRGQTLRLRKGGILEGSSSI
jgi:ceramide glucosyltransferase